MTRLSRVAAVAAILPALAGCGSLGVRELPPAAEPASSPPLHARPAGAVVAVGPHAEGIAVDPATGRVAVALADPPRLAILDGATGAVVHRVPLPGTARHVIGSGGDFVLGAETANRLLEVTPAGRVNADVPVGSRPHDSAVVAGRAFVGDEGGRTVTVVRGRRVVGTLPVATQPGGLAAVQGRMLAVVSVRERVLELFDARTLRRVGRAGAGIGPTHVVAFGPYVFVADTTGGALLVFRVAPTLRLINRVYLPGGPYGMALDPVHGMLWITLTARNEVVEMPARHRPRVLLRFPTVRQPDTVAVDARRGRVFVAGRRAGVVQILTP